MEQGWRIRKKEPSYLLKLYNAQNKTSLFLQRLNSAVNRMIWDHEVGKSKVNLLAFENVNSECKMVIGPWKVKSEPQMNGYEI